MNTVIKTIAPIRDIETHRAFVASRQRMFALLFAFIASLGAAFAQSGTCGDHLTWKLEKGVLTISGTGAMTDYNLMEEEGYVASDAPWYENGHLIDSIIIMEGVTSIGNSAFCECSLISVTIPNSVTSIGDGAFYNCSGLTSISIPGSVTSIGFAAFAGCSGISSPIFNDHVFACMPTSYSGTYTIPFGIETVAGGAFQNCRNLTAISIPNSVTRIGDYAFAYCNRLTSVTCCSLTPPMSDSIHLLEPDPEIEEPVKVTLYVPTGFAEVYRNSNFGRQFSYFEEIYLRPSMLLSAELNATNEQLSKIIELHNEVISHSPYTQCLSKGEQESFMETYTPVQIPDAYDFVQAKEFCDNLQRMVDSLSWQDPVVPVKEYVRETRPKEYVRIYLQENPTVKSFLESEHKEYRCHYASFTDFVLQYEQGRLQLAERNCREMKWSEYADYYASRDLFDIDYNHGDAVINEYRSRIDQAWWSIQNLPEKVLKKNLQGTGEDAKEDILRLITLFNQLAPAPVFQLKAADFMISNNKKMGKEYEKNGAFFPSKAHFIAVYFSKDYKQIIKSKQ